MEAIKHRNQEFESVDSSNVNAMEVWQTTHNIFCHSSEYS